MGRKNYDITWAIFLVTRTLQFLQKQMPIFPINRIFPVTKTGLAIGITRWLFAFPSGVLGATSASFGALTPRRPITPTC